MIRELNVVAVILVVGGWMFGCASSEPAVESSEDVQPERMQEVESIYPAWFEPGMEGAMADGELIGYGRAISNSEETSHELARENALEGMRYRIDRVLEQETAALEAAWSGDGSVHVAIRNAVASLDLSDGTWKTEVISELTPTAAVVAEVRIDSDLVVDQLMNSLNLEPIRSLFEQTAE